MIENVLWSKRAEWSYGRIIGYIADSFGRTRAKQYARIVYREVNQLKTNPGLGQEEPLLAGARYEFRRLVIEDLTKIIYRVTDNSIEIVDVWDTRQNAEDLAARLITFPTN